VGLDIEIVRDSYDQQTCAVSPATWNALPDYIRTVADPVKFRKLFKSHYFSQTFNVC